MPPFGTHSVLVNNHRKQRVCHGGRGKSRAHIYSSEGRFDTEKQKSRLAADYSGASLAQVRVGRNAAIVGRSGCHGDGIRGFLPRFRFLPRALPSQREDESLGPINSSERDKRKAVLLFGSSSLACTFSEPSNKRFEDSSLFLYFKHPPCYKRNRTIAVPYGLLILAQCPLSVHIWYYRSRKQRVCHGGRVKRKKADRYFSGRTGRFRKTENPVQLQIIRGRRWLKHAGYKMPLSGEEAVPMATGSALPLFAASTSVTEMKVWHHQLERER
ncbi:hypothetical protein CDAR_583641 [Caerostris darwini]|uniref:Uncharacterized protein n=1 Tax=Caerostris darwini TaxID=1538125 RepID=A0AAV4QQ59_9ARAC|nr:hypothetical protein CDAR_583641 [Caerostris darwini]